jgi:8-oxo-dGTP diphosphatase
MKIGVMILISDEQDRILLLKRPPGHSYPDQWCMPGGKIDAGETADVAIHRETVEETGIVLKAYAKVDLILADSNHLCYPYVAAYNHEYREVTKKFPNDEHVEFGWFRAEELPKNTSGMVYSLLDHLAIDESFDLSAEDTVFEEVTD